MTTEEKLCPLSMASPLVPSPCQRERCMAWVPDSLETNEGKAYGRIAKSEGYCKLIERR